MARGLKKGQTNNPAGRPKGKPNRTTTEIKALVVQFIGKNITTLQKDFDQLEPKDRLAFIEKILKYAVPTMTQNQVDFSKMTEEQIDEIVNKLTEDIK